MNRRSLFLLLLLVWSVPGIVAGSLTLALFPSREPGASAGMTLAAQLLSWWVWALLTPFILFMLARFPIDRDDWPRSIPPHAVAAIACGVLFTFTTLVTARLASPATAAEPIARLLRAYLGSRIPIGMLLYAAVVGIATALTERGQRRAREIQSAQLAAELARSQVQALQMQLQPHFLFNTLHTIALLVQEDPPRATRTITRLGDLLRRTLSLSDTPELALGEEIALLRHYLEIEETRFGDRLTVTIDVPDALHGARVPSLLLQPIVENAVRHGVAARVEGGRVEIVARRQGAQLVLSVSDDGPGFADAVPTTSGIGLSSSRRRLAVLYGARASLQCDSDATGGARVTITMPINDA